jgi:hypothetical protein
MKLVYHTWLLWGCCNERTEPQQETQACAILPPHPKLPLRVSMHAWGPNSAQSCMSGTFLKQNCMRRQGHDTHRGT